MLNRESLFMRLRWTLPLVTLLLLGAETAHAAPTVAMSTVAVTRYAADQTTPYGCPGRNSQTNSCLVDGTSQGVGYHDCIDDTTLKFSITMTGVPDASYNLQVWAGTGDCTAAGATNNALTGICWPVHTGLQLATPQTIYVRVADIVSYLGQTAPNIPQQYTSGISAVDACNGAESSSGTTTVTDDAGNTTATAGESTVTVYFLVFQNGQPTPTSSASYGVKVKLVGPNAVTDLVAGTGDGEIIATWTPPAGDTTVTGFNLYAVPEGTTIGDGGTQTVCSDAQAGTQLLDDAGNPVLDDAGNPVYVDDAGNPVTQDAGCTTQTTGGSTATCSGTSGSVDVSSIECPSGGDAGAAICQQVIGTTNTKGAITGLSNGTNYVVAVAAFDQFGNAGAVSTAACAAPAPIDDFWKVYNQDGGSAFCALEVVGKRGGGVAAALMSLVGLVWMRRRRSARRTERR
jgi:hypothetical protein